MVHPATVAGHRRIRQTRLVIGLRYVPTGSQIRPWIRYWARTCDFIAFSSLVGFIAAFAAPQILEIPDTLFGVLLLAVFVVVEPALFAMWGTTPFKALLKVRVRNQNGSKLTFSQSLRRCLKVLDPWSRTWSSAHFPDHYHHVVHPPQERWRHLLGYRRWIHGHPS